MVAAERADAKRSLRDHFSRLKSARTLEVAHDQAVLEPAVAAGGAVDAGRPAAPEVADRAVAFPFVVKTIPDLDAAFREFDGFIGRGQAAENPGGLG